MLGYFPREKTVDLGGGQRWQYVTSVGFNLANVFVSYGVLVVNCYRERGDSWNFTWIEFRIRLEYELHVAHFKSRTLKKNKNQVEIL